MIHSPFILNSLSIFTLFQSRTKNNHYQSIPLLLFPLYCLVLIFRRITFPFSSPSTSKSSIRFLRCLIFNNSFFFCFYCIFLPTSTLPSRLSHNGPITVAFRCRDLAALVILLSCGEMQSLFVGVSVDPLRASLTILTEL